MGRGATRSRGAWSLLEGRSGETDRGWLVSLRRQPASRLRTLVKFASSLGADGFDTSALGKRWLSYPKAEYFLPEHGAYRVDRENGAMFIFGSLDERFATPVLTALSQSTNPEQKEIATSLLMSQATPEALAAVAAMNPEGLSSKAAASRKALLQNPGLIEPRDTPKTTRSQFRAAFAALLAGDEGPVSQLVADVPDGERDLVAVLTSAEDIDLIRKVRRLYITRNTQHAIEYYNQFSQVIMTLVWKPDLDGIKRWSGFGRWWRSEAIRVDAAKIGTARPPIGSHDRSRGVEDSRGSSSPAR